MSMSAWIRLPGLFYRREFEDVIKPAGPNEPGEDWYVAAACADSRGQPLFSIYHRPHDPDRVDSDAGGDFCARHGQGEKK